MADAPGILGVCLVGRDGRVVQCSQTLADWLGLAPAALGSQPLRDHLPGIEELFERVLHTGQRQHLHTTVAGRDVDLTADPLWEGDGQVRGVLFLLADRAGSSARHGALEHEIHAPTVFSAPPATAVTARLYGALPLPESHPQEFAELQDAFAVLMDQALQQREYRVSHPISEQLRVLSDRLGQLQAGPRDVIAVYRAALQGKALGAGGLKAQAYVEEGRLLALELMGHLVSYYRLRSLGMREDSQTGSPSGVHEP